MCEEGRWYWNRGGHLIFAIVAFVAPVWSLGGLARVSDTGREVRKGTAAVLTAGGRALLATKAFKLLHTLFYAGQSAVVGHFDLSKQPC